MDEDPPSKSVPLARLLLVGGGLVGAHKVYVNRLPEAFIRLSTAGIGLLGLFYDSFTVAADVDEFNEATTREKKGRKSKAVSSHVPFSMRRFVASLLYAGWLALLAWAAASLTYSKHDQSGGRMMAGLTIAVTLGVYISGNCGGQRRNLYEIFFAVSGVVPMAMGPLLDWSPLQSAAAAASIGTIVGNRTAKRAHGAEDRLSRVHFVLWTSLFLLNSVLLVDGLDRQCLRREFTIESQSGVKPVDARKLSVQTLVGEWFTNPNATRQRFAAAAGGGGEAPLQVKFLPLTRKEPQYLEYLGAQPGVPSPAWIEHLSGAIVDSIRAAAEGRSDWADYAFTRRYLITMLETPPLTTDVALRKKCEETRRKKKTGMKKEETARLGLITKSCEALKL